MGPDREGGGEREERQRRTTWAVFAYPSRVEIWDSVTLSMPLTTELLAANPRVAENTGRVAIQRGPIVYCMEELDQASGTEAADVSIALGGKTERLPSGTHTRNARRSHRPSSPGGHRRGSVSRASALWARQPRTIR